MHSSVRDSRLIATKSVAGLSQKKCPEGDSNPCRVLERDESWARLDDRDLCSGDYWRDIGQVT